MIFLTSGESNVWERPSVILRRNVHSRGTLSRAIGDTFTRIDTWLDLFDGNSLIRFDATESIRHRCGGKRADSFRLSSIVPCSWLTSILATRIPSSCEWQVFAPGRKLEGKRGSTVLTELRWMGRAQRGGSF